MTQPMTRDVVRAAEIRAGLEALHVEAITIRRRISDRYGARPIANIEYTVEEFAAKLADGMVDAAAMQYVAPELRRPRVMPEDDKRALRDERIARGERIGW